MMINNYNMGVINKTLTLLKKLIGCDSERNLDSDTHT